MILKIMKLKFIITRLLLLNYQVLHHCSLNYAKYAHKYAKYPKITP